MHCMKVLCIIPPHVPDYFNAGHHLHVFSAAAYLRKHLPASELTALDAGALNKSWKDICNLLSENNYDLIAIMNDYGIPDAVSNFVRYSRELLPHSKLVTFGRLSHQIPGFFKRYDLDGIVASGDFEAALLSFANFVDTGQLPEGVLVKQNAVWQEALPGKLLAAEDWEYPSIDEIPYDAYERLYLDDSNKFCGIPQRRELVVQVSRGCPVACFFCEVTAQQGKKERRRTVESVLNYVETSIEKVPFEYVSMYSPTFTLDKAWVNSFVSAYKNRQLTIPWKCTTTTFHLDRELVKHMADANCIRISVGLETLGAPGQTQLPAIKRVAEKQFIELADACKQAGVELNCFVVIGLPGQTVDDAAYTIELVRNNGARVRPTIYTPYHELSPDMDEQNVLSFNRQCFANGNGLDPVTRKQFIRLAHGVEYKPTGVMARIPVKIHR